MTLETLQKSQLKEIGDYLDDLTPKRRGRVEEEYWRLLIAAGSKARDAATRAAFDFTNSEVEGFAMAQYRRGNKSPGLALLKRLMRSELTVDAFVKLLKEIRCQGAVNVFVPAGSYIHCKMLVELCICIVH